jgi:hypothetical protein
MEQLQVGVDTSMIALWVWHKSVAATQTYLHIHLALREVARGWLAISCPRRKISTDVEAALEQRFDDGAMRNFALIFACSPNV